MLSILSVLLAVGVVVQIGLGESGLAARGLRDVHATIGLAGLFLTAYALRMARGSKPSLTYLSVLLAATLVQAILGLILYGLISVELRQFPLVSEIHRFNSYFILFTGLVGGILIGIARRRAASAHSVSQS